MHGGESIVVAFYTRYTFAQLSHTCLLLQVSAVWLETSWLLATCIGMLIIKPILHKCNFFLRLLYMLTHTHTHKLFFNNLYQFVG